MDIEAFQQYLQKTHLSYKQWGLHVAQKIEALLRADGLPVSFIKIPVTPRVKAPESALGKLGRKGYTDPLRQMTDLVGVRFVVLLAEEVDLVCDAIQRETSWDANVSRDVEEEIKKNTKIFDYQSQHFEVRPREPMVLDGETISTDMCCEVQVRTLLQHAYAEMVHDNIYKPSGLVPVKAERYVARSMALMETTDELFSQTMGCLKEANAPRVELLKDITAIYRDKVGGQYLAADDKSAIVLIDEFRERLSDGLASDIRALLECKKYIPLQITKRAASVPLFNQAAVLFVYWLALNHDTDDLVNRWPLPGYRSSLDTILSDLDRRPSR
ncbi:RelA/SpoT domain-containing protein [Pseudomonas sp. TMP9]|uniref:GTP pyrophosphokinase n=1 Tax=Pseudomonas sp. TMP9 TaxID=3133144 RepID=UPI0030CA85FC